MRWAVIAVSVSFLLCVAWAQSAGPLPPGVSISEVWETPYYRVRYYEDPLRKTQQSSNLARVIDNFLSGERTVEMTGVTDDQYWFDGHRDNFELQVRTAFARLFQQYNFTGTPLRYCKTVTNTIPGLLNHSSEPLPPFVNNRQPGNIYQTTFTTLRSEIWNAQFPGVNPADVHYPTSVLNGAASANQYVLVNLKSQGQGPIPAEEIQAYCSRNNQSGRRFAAIVNLCAFYEQ